METGTYNGYPSYNHWNVSLWINNDENIYRDVYNLLEKYTISQSIKYFLFHYNKTPDGVYYTSANLRYVFSMFKKDHNL